MDAYRKRELADHLHGVSRRGLAAEEFCGGERPVPVHVLPVRPVAPVLCPVGKILIRLPKISRSKVQREFDLCTLHPVLQIWIVVS